ASRPIVRGQDGDRISILQNGGGAADASSLSYDHSVPVDALVTERVEVLRGPSALLYGGNAIGGVVNLIDNRIPSEPIDGVTGRADVGYGTGSNEKSGAVVLDGGNERFGLHVDAFDRRSDDVAVPIELGCSRPGSPAFAYRICNSANEARGGAVGGSLFFDQGYIGASASTYRSNYGTVAEDDVTIGMRSDRYALEGEWRPQGGFFTSVHGKFSQTDYRHTEYEGPLPGTTFTNKSNDLRIEARHAKVAGFEGLIGLSSQGGDFAASGEEAFAPNSRTRSNAVYLQEEYGTSWGRWSLGARAEHVDVTSLGYPEDPAVTRFVTGERSFNPVSAALGGLWNLSPEWKLTSSLAYTERAPKDYELFANGPHLATGAWELGDPDLKLEKSTGIDIGTAWTRGANSARLNVFATRFSNYIGLNATGRDVDESGNVVEPGSADGLPEYAYRGVPARFVGFEASGTQRLLGRDGFAPTGDLSTLALEWRGDMVRATDTRTGQPLPRIPPFRVGATLAYGNGPWTARLGFDYNAAQDRVPLVGARATDAYTLWNASLNYRMNVKAAVLTWYARIDNLTNQLAYPATSILTTTVYPDAPLPGRSLKVGLRVNF
ncbi:MAG: TonB-dependent receptor, partial [Variovorax sp.]